MKKKNVTTNHKRPLIVACRSGVVGEEVGDDEEEGAFV